tara:strand:+ start:3331 stop:5562 length:2232 start_codon:yes stop_codon:yes gene_type:complete
MKIKNIILGERSYLSNELKKQIKNSSVFSLSNFPYHKIKNENFNIIINSFYSSLKLKKINNYEVFFNKSILELSKFLDKFPKYKIRKIIYTSSSAIYNSINDLDFKDNRNRKIYSSTKFVAENLIKNFCTKNDIKFCIARVFNIYGENEKFSVISKILECYKKKSVKLPLINNGNSVRDFIHINQVIKYYKEIIKNNKNEIIDVGSGYGTKIKDIIEILGYKNFNLKKIKDDENSISIAANLKKNINIKKNLENFFLKKLKLKKKIKLAKISSTKKNILHDYLQGSVIYGAGEAGKKLFKIYKQTNKDFVSFFVDDDKSLIKKKYIDGKKILPFQDLVKISKKKIINNIIIAIPSLSSKNLRNLINKLSPLTLNISIVNSNLLGENSYLNLSDVTDTVLSDLFKRKHSTKLNLLKTLSKKKILITGAGGSIGSELVKQALGSNSEVLALDHSELALYNLEKELNIGFNLKNIKFILGSILDKDLLISLMRNQKIDIVFHAAAYKHVNILENNISLAVKNNIIGTLNILDIFNNKNIKKVIISTDKATRPKSILGATKRISEIISQSYVEANDQKSNIKVVRFGNVFGSKGSAIELFIDQLNKKLPLTLTDYKVKRYFMSVREACNLVIQVTNLKNKGKIFILNMGEQIFMKNVIYKLAEIKNIKKEDIVIHKIGLNKGEKLYEELSIGKRFYKTANKDIFVTNEPTYNNNKVHELISKLKKHLHNNDDKFLKNTMFSFLSGEK